MRRLRILLAALLPVFWLAVSSHGSSSGPGKGAVAHYLRPAAVLHAAQGQEPATRGVAASRGLTRHFTRRVATSSGASLMPLLLTVHNSELSGLGELQVRFDNTQAPTELAPGWQFRWRTALMPRAPSLVS